MLWQHQRDAIAWAAGRLCVLLHMGMGTGKSRCLLEILKGEGLSKVLICCPKAVVPAWGKQAGLWLQDYRILLLTKGSSKQKEQLVAAAMADSRPPGWPTTSRADSMICENPAWRTASSLASSGPASEMVSIPKSLILAL